MLSLLLLMKLVGTRAGRTARVFRVLTAAADPFAMMDHAAAR